MRFVDAYKQQQKAAPTRIDLILSLYRKALEQMDRAGRLLQDQRSGEAHACLTKAQLIVAGLGAGMAGSTDATTRNFQRLYEFVSHKLSRGTAEDIVAARKVLMTLLEAFEAIRTQAVALESQGAIPPLDVPHQMHLLA